MGCRYFFIITLIGRNARNGTIEKEELKKKKKETEGKGEEKKEDEKKKEIGEQGRIHGNSVADGWAGAVMRNPLAIQKCDGRTEGPTDTARCRVACPRLKRKEKSGLIMRP